MFLFKVINEQLVRLYIVPNRKFPKGLPETTVFKTKTKFEIGDIRWFPLKDVNQRSCYNARPFLRDIETFVGRFKKEQLMLLRKFNSRKQAVEKVKDVMDKKETFVSCIELYSLDLEPKRRRLLHPIPKLLCTLL